MPDFEVVDETPDWIVVAKPAPLQVHPAKPGSPPTLLHGLKALLCYEMENGASLSIITRLDRETSGIVLIAKNRATARIFGKAMMRHQFKKRYLAICWGWPKEDEFDVDAPLLRLGEVAESPIYLMQAVHPQGAESRTRFRVLRRFEKKTTNGQQFSLLSCFPETGRMHQIRVHAKEAGFPLVGDKLYGQPGHQCYLEHIAEDWTESLHSRLLLPRHALHAHRLELELEDFGAFHWEAPLPRDMAEFASEDCSGEPEP